ncbi:MAG: 16S rRNA (adenine(1518)-N(6)/adenine(1519)-N(6))-dimethyltransferase RsmA [Coriobacteriia bacterium]|nr:16S rRNA (adenine(1518)-N(6)/adenine(1519)-N(6))-dimethyltransferase RsmA [Coriobacteriia bacterium]
MATSGLPFDDGTKLSPLSAPSVTRAVLEAHGLATKHSLGQNFLVNDAILQKIVDLAQLDAADSVLEVGPGIGTLTIALLKTAGRVASVERDPDLPPVLAQTCAPWANTFTLLEKDALDLQLSDLDATALPTKLVANLPYAVAATVVLDYFERFANLQSATVMVQKEVADRMCAQVGTKNYGAYTVKLRLYAQPAGRFPVSPNNFFPPPRVDSAVLRLDRYHPCDANGQPLTLQEVKAAATMAEAAFASRRKTIANSCKTYFATRQDVDVAALLNAAGIDPKRRGETLSLQEFIALGKAFLR